jgi:50S ribosomal subunit-associated GTPase HflX
LETDRRLLRNRITMIEQRLEKVRSQREQGRRSRSGLLFPLSRWWATPTRENPPCSIG